MNAVRSCQIKDTNEIHSGELFLGHLCRLTDQTGLVQHARFSEPNYDEGYCVDDNARALMLMCKLSVDDHIQAADLREMATRYFMFTIDAWNPHCSRFRNFRSANLFWLENQGSEDSHGRALHALGCAANCETWSDIAVHARNYFEKAIHSMASFSSPRAWAFALLGIDEYLMNGEDRCEAGKYQISLANKLFGRYQFTATCDWLWFENILSYCNARLPHALLISGYAMGRDDMVQSALDSFTWLSQIHAVDDGTFTPIGSNGFYRKGGRRAQFDQQPIEAYSVVAASIDAYRLTSDNFWLDEAIRANQWFHGHNDLGVSVCDPQAGTCYDGLHPDRVNQNLGAESTLAYLLSSADLRRMYLDMPCLLNGDYQ